MNEHKDEQNESTGGQPIEKTHEMYEKGGPAPGTLHAGEEGALAGGKPGDDHELEKIDVNEHNRPREESSSEGIRDNERS